MEKQIKIALAGNPNCGKTTLFNALTGSNQFVGNWPGVTVEKKEGKLKKHDDVVIMDLPGIYSLSPYTLEEVVARNYLISERPDAILNIVDGTNLELAISLLMAILASLTLTMTLPPMVEMTVTVPPATMPRSSRCFFTSGLPPTFRIMFSSPASVRVSGIIYIPPYLSSVVG